MKKPWQLKRMSDATLSRYRLDLEDELVAMAAALALAKREQRARRAKRKAAKGCGRKAKPDARLLPEVRTLQ